MIRTCCCPGTCRSASMRNRRRLGCAEVGTEAPDASQLACLLFHSLAARYAEVLRSLQEITGKRINKIYVMGGASRNELLNRLTSEATGLPVQRAGVEASTIGNFAVQLARLENGEEAAPGARAIAAWAERLGQFS